MKNLSTLTIGLATTAAMSLPMAAAGENRVDQVRPDAPALAAYGPLPIGVQTRSFTDPGRIDIVNVDADNQPIYDRSVTAEIWYPAAEGTEPGGTYTAFLRDGQTEVTLHGRASRDAAPASGQTYPLVIISHGYPGNRFLMAHLGENLASKGYVAVSLDHPDSTYDDMTAFGSTLYNRPLDQLAALDAMAALDDDLGAITDADTAAVVGYSMGGYGALIFGGAGVSEASVGYPWGTPAGLLGRHQAGSETHAALPDPRVKAIIAIGPWGMNYGFWDAEGLGGFSKPLMLIAGGVDDVSDYASIRRIFEGTTGSDRQLLTFESANHNAAAPMPAPMESWTPVDTLDFVPFEHYADAVWDTNRMNNILHHFATAFLDSHLKADAQMAPYLDLIEVAQDGVIAMGEDGKPTEAHSHWHGFAPRTAKGLRFETRSAAQ